MRYVCHRRARFEGISGRVNIPYGAALERRGDFLYYQGRQLCAARSQRAHEHFKRDDDGQGLRRGALTEAICKTPERSWWISGTGMLTKTPPKTVLLSYKIGIPTVSVEARKVPPSVPT